MGELDFLARNMIQKLTVSCPLKFQDLRIWAFSLPTLACCAPCPVYTSHGEREAGEHSKHHSSPTEWSGPVHVCIAIILKACWVCFLTASQISFRVHPSTDLHLLLFAQYLTSSISFWTDAESKMA